MNISFIIPAYNCADTIRETIVSIYNDNFEEGDEVIIIDDASTDSTSKIIEELSKKYPSIKIVKHNINKGSAAAGRNTGIDVSKNELIFCLDADNVLSPKSISLLKHILLEQKADAVAFGEIHYFKTTIDEVTHKWLLKNSIDILDNINEATQTPCSSGNYLFTKNSWYKAGRYIEHIGGAYDSWAFGMKQLFSGAKILTLPDTFYYHRYGYESTFVKDVGKANVSITLLQVILPFIEQIHSDDVNYIMGEYGRYTWYEKINQRPIRLCNKYPIKLSLISIVVRKIHNLTNFWLYKHD